MPNVVFVAPFFMDATLRFIDAAAQLPGVRLGLVSQDPAEKLPAALRQRLAAHAPIAEGTDREQILAGTRAIARQLGSVDRVLGTLEQLQVTLAEVRAALGIPGLSVEAAHNFRDKSRMKSLLQAAGLPCARHRLIADARAGLDFAATVGFPIVVKPPAGAGARNTFRVDTLDALQQALAAMPLSAATPTLLEEFITGQEHSFDSVCVRGQLVWHSISRYFPTPLEVLHNPWIQWVVILPREIDSPQFADIRQAAARSLAVLGLETGLTHMEWFRRRDGSVAISEVAARPPGAQFTTLLSYAHDTDMYRAWAHLMVFDEFTSPARVYATGAAFLRGQGTGRVRAIHGLEQVQREVGALVVESKLPSTGQQPTGTYEGEGYVIVRHPDTAVVEEALRRIVSVVRVELS
jgi:biotin carboxylase